MNDTRYPMKMLLAPFCAISGIAAALRRRMIAMNSIMVPANAAASASEPMMSLSMPKLREAMLLNKPEATAPISVIRIPNFRSLIALCNDSGAAACHFLTSKKNIHIKTYAAIDATATMPKRANMLTTEPTLTSSTLSALLNIAISIAKPITARSVHPIFKYSMLRCLFHIALTASFQLLAASIDC